MPIIEPAPWRHQYFAHVPCPEDVMVPADDPEAWAANPRHRWVFDKLQIALSQGLEAAPHGLEPAHYPVFSKPIFNFGGLGAGSCVLLSRSEYLARNTPGHMWMPCLEGAHVSTDLAIVNGAVRWSRHATGMPTGGGTFDYWTVHAAAQPALEQRLNSWVKTHLDGYTGLFNAETIGGVIIDAHLRFADQWPDLYGAGWVEALVSLYSTGAWNFSDPGRRDGYSLALFLPHGRRYGQPPAVLVGEIKNMAGVSSVQITFYPDKPPEAHSMPPGGFRVALVNAHDLELGKKARARLAQWFSA